MEKRRVITTTFAELKQFTDTINEDWYFEEDGTIPEYFWDEKKKYNPVETVTIEEDEIYIMWQGRGEPPGGGEGKEFVAEFRKWKTGLDYKFLVIRVNKPDEKAVRELLKQHKIQVEG